MRGGIKCVWVVGRCLVGILAAGGSAAAAINLVICMVEMEAGSAFDIFFTAEPTGEGVSVAAAVSQLNSEYQEWS